MMDKDTNNQLNENKTIDYMKDYRKKTAGIVVIALSILLIVFVVYFVNFYGSLSSRQEDFGTFGDFVGGTLNPIFAFASFLALLYTIIVQLSQLKQNQEELQMTREELRLTRIESATQSKTFENSNHLQIFSHQFERLNKLEESVRFKIGDNEASDYKKFAIRFFESNYQTSYPSLIPILEALIGQIKVIQAYINSIEDDKLKQLLQNEFDIHKKAFYDNKMEAILCTIVSYKHYNAFQKYNSIEEYKKNLTNQSLSELEYKVLSGLIDEIFNIFKQGDGFQGEIRLFFKKAYSSDEHMKFKKNMKDIIWEN